MTCEMPQICYSNRFDKLIKSIFHSHMVFRSWMNVGFQSCDVGVALDQTADVEVDR